MMMMIMMIMRMVIMMMTYPSPEAKDPSKYSNQFLDRPDHLDKLMEMTLVKCLLEKNMP